MGVCHLGPQVVGTRTHCLNAVLCRHTPMQAFLYMAVITSSKAQIVVQMVQNLPAMQDTRVYCLGREDSLEEGMATHSSILAWRIPWTKEPGGL